MSDVLLPVSAAVLLTLFFTVLYLNLRAGEKQIHYGMEHRFAVSDPEFVRNMNHLLGPVLLPGNGITALQNGDRIFPAMLDAIRGARQSVNFETYIYWSGEIGRQFSEALCERARAGVGVHVMLDWAGSGKIDRKVL